MTTTLAMPHRLDRSILINASRETVFGYFTDSTRWARWWGQGSTIDARAGGAVQIVHPGGVQVAGEILEIDPPARLVFTYGYVSGTPMPVGASVVTIQLDDDHQGTRLNLSHVFTDENARNEMAQGWRFQLSLFGNLVTNDLHAGATTDSWPRHQGWDLFYGFLCGETNHWYPSLTVDTTTSTSRTSPRRATTSRRTWPTRRSR